MAAARARAAARGEGITPVRASLGGGAAAAGQINSPLMMHFEIFEI